MRIKQKKIAVVTGASCGIGKAVAVNFSKKGYHTILIARSENNLEAVKKEIVRAGNTATVCPVDISNYRKVNFCLQDIVSKHKRIDVLFNSAGVIYSGTSEINPSDLKRMIEVNLIGVICVANAVAKQMKKQKFGYIFNVSSVRGKVASPRQGGYSASKFGLNGYGDALTQELIQYGIKVTTLCLGNTNTSMAAEFVKKTNINPRELVQTEDIVSIVNYLLSLGNNIVVNEMVVLSSLLLRQQVINYTRPFAFTN